MFEITMMATVASLCRRVFSPLMGKLADKISFSRNMTICLAIAGVGFLVNAFTVPEFKWIHMAYICLYYIAMAGINSGSINLIFDFVPLSGRQAAMGLKNAIGGVLGFVSGLLGGLILGAIQGADGKGRFHLFGLELYAQQFLSFISFVMIALLILYMFFVIFPLQKKREAERKAAFSLEEESADV
jgi:MFS family permease